MKSPLGIQNWEIDTTMETFGRSPPYNSRAQKKIYCLSRQGNSKIDFVSSTEAFINIPDTFLSEEVHFFRWKRILPSLNEKLMPICIPTECFKIKIGNIILYVTYRLHFKGSLNFLPRTGANFKFFNWPIKISTNLHTNVFLLEFNIIFDCLKFISINIVFYIDI